METDNKKLWDTVLIELELVMTGATFTMWFKDTYIIKNDGGAIQIAVPTTFAETWIRGKFHNIILKLLRNLVPSVRSVEYVVCEKRSSEQSKTIKKQLETKTKELPLNEMVISRDDNLNPKYTFDTFVVGPFNEFAFAACQTIIKKPVVYNPLYIYGNTGLGKTHIMQAVGNHIKKSGSYKKIYYITSERFSQEMIDLMQAGKMGVFKEKYRKYDVFIMDDIQFLSNKEKTQEELFHLFNYLHENNKQIIFSSDVHPNFIAGLESRLKSRFVSGMIVDIPQPDYESRLEIIKKKAFDHGVSLKKEVMEFLAKELDGNIREIEGALNSISQHIELKEKDPSIEVIKSILKTEKKSTKNLTTKEVVKIVANFYNIEEDSIYEKSRKKEIIKPRQVLMYLLREFLDVSFPSIGQKIGGRDHTTAIHSYEKIKEGLKTDPELIQEIDQLRQLL